MTDPKKKWAIFGITTPSMFDRRAERFLAIKFGL
jgi:hypothetical protein